MTYYLSEIFESIQGEGNCAGASSLFVRFGRCNLACSWCDSKFTWRKNDSGKVMTADEIRHLIEKSSASNVIFTGGEPTLYKLDKLVVPNKKFHVETNGTIIPIQPLDIILPDKTPFHRVAMSEGIIKNFNWVISPKMKNAGEKLNDEAMQFWAKKDWGIFKFIIQNKTDLLELEQVLEKYQIAKKRVFIGLEGCTAESQIRPELVDFIVEMGYNFSPRLHVVLWGNKRKK
jgi:7-carboxy-7-deazaguanine synthase